MQQGLLVKRGKTTGGAILTSTHVGQFWQDSSLGFFYISKPRPFERYTGRSFELTTPRSMRTRSSSADGRVEKLCSADAEEKLGMCGLLPCSCLGCEALIASMLRWVGDAPTEAQETQDEPVCPKL